MDTKVASMEQEHNISPWPGSSIHTGQRPSVTVTPAQGSAARPARHMAPALRSAQHRARPAAPRPCSGHGGSLWSRVSCAATWPRCSDAPAWSQGRAEGTGNGCSPGGEPPSLNCMEMRLAKGPPAAASRPSFPRSPCEGRANPYTQWGAWSQAPPCAPAGSPSRHPSGTRQASCTLPPPRAPLRLGVLRGHVPVPSPHGQCGQQRAALPVPRRGLAGGSPGQAATGELMKNRALPSGAKELVCPNGAGPAALGAAPLPVQRLRPPAASPPLTRPSPPDLLCSRFPGSAALAGTGGSFPAAGGARAPVSPAGCARSPAGASAPGRWSRAGPEPPPLPRASGPQGAAMGRAAAHRSVPARVSGRAPLGRRWSWRGGICKR